MKGMLHEIRGNILVSAQGDVPVDDADWDSYLAAVDGAKSVLKGFLISADNHGPNAGQRAKLAMQTLVEERVTTIRARLRAAPRRYGTPPVPSGNHEPRRANER
jgi:hypothetical protein